MTETFKFDLLSNVGKFTTLQEKYDFLSEVRRLCETHMNLIAEKSRVPMAEVLDE